MTKKKPGAKRGQPKKKVDWEQAKRLAQHFMTIEQIAAILGISRNTLNARAMEDHGISCSEFLTANRTKSEAMLMGVTLKKAKEGDTKCLLYMNEKYVAPRNAPAPQAKKVEVSLTPNEAAADALDLDDDALADIEKLLGVDA